MMRGITIRNEVGEITRKMYSVLVSSPRRRKRDVELEARSRPR